MHNSLKLKATGRSILLWSCPRIMGGCRCQRRPAPDHPEVDFDFDRPITVRTGKRVY